MVLNAILNPILRPLFVLGDFWAMVLITFAVSLLVTLIYKYVTDQAMMKQLKEEIKKLQQQAKEHKKDPGKMMAIQKQMMDKNMVLMKHSFKPTLITFLPLILIMGWLQANVAFDPVLPDQPFTVMVQTEKGFSGAVGILDTPDVEILNGANQTPQNGMATFELKAVEGLHTLQFQAGGATFSADVRVGGKGAVLQATAVKRNGIKQVLVGYPKNILMDLGFIRLGWIGTYIILSLIFSIGLRKLLKVY